MKYYVSVTPVGHWKGGIRMAFVLSLDVLSPPPTAAQLYGAQFVIKVV